MLGYINRTARIVISVITHATERQIEDSIAQYVAKKQLQERELQMGSLGSLPRQVGLVPEGQVASELEGNYSLQRASLV